MFSQWATKRVCKFFMKRLLGRVLRSELDLEQLEVQLGSGRMQLRDLALNTDYINDQLGDSSVILKEGSVGSVRAKIPWKVLTAEPCEIDVDELELVFMPRPMVESRNETPAFSTCNDLRDGDLHQSAAADVDLGGTAGGTYIGVDDGVRMIAKMVERVLLGLRVKVTNLIGVFENDSPGCFRPSSEQDLKQGSCGGMLVIRVAYAEYGIESPKELQEPNVFGIAAGAESSMLVKVISFKGASVEVMDFAQTAREAELSRSCREGACTESGFIHGQSVPIVFGEGGGVAGTIQLSMPWKDGVIDVPKVNAELVIGHVRIKASTKEVQHLLSLAQAYSRPESVAGGPGPRTTSQSTVSFYEPAGSGRGSSVMFAEKHKDLSRSAFKPSASMGVVTDIDPSQAAFLPVTKFISDWMQWGGSDSPKRDISVAEADLAASVDEFFECFDGTWSSHASSTASGLWNWTRSAFTAITAASSLASGSMVLSPGSGRQVEYSVKVKLAGLSVSIVSGLTRADTCETPGHFPDPAPEEGLVDGMAEECLEIQFMDCVLSVAVSGRETNLRITIESVKVFEVVNVASASSDGGCQIKSVESVLPSFPVLLSEDVRSSDRCSSVLATGGDSLDASSVIKRFQRKLLLRVVAAQTSAARVAVTVQQAPGMNAGPGGRKASRDICSSIELKAYFQPIVLFLDVYALKRIVELVTVSTLESCRSQGQGEHHLEHPGKMASGVDQMLVDLDKRCEGGFGVAAPAATSGQLPWEGIFEASLFAPQIRVIVGFPGYSESGLNQLRDDVVAFDMTIPVGKVGVAEPLLAFKHTGRVKNTSDSQVEDSVSLRFGDGVIYLISSGEGIASSSKRSCYSSPFVLGVDHIARFSGNCCEWENAATPMHTDEQSSLEIKWFNQAKAGAWLAKRAWDAALAQQRRADGMGGSNSEFASATAAEFGDEESLQLREDIVSCSSAIIHLRVPRVWINLSGSQHMLIYELFSSFLNTLSVEKPKAVEKNPRNTNSRPSKTMGGIGPPTVFLQTSLLVECAHVDIVLHPSSGQASDWDILTGEVENLQVLSVSQMGGRPDVSFFWLQHEECQIIGSYPGAQSTTLTGDSDLLLFSCRRDNLGRGDGGEGNALAPGAAGISLTYMAWPGRDQIADMLLIGSMRGATFVAHSGRLDWISALVAYFAESPGSSSTTRTEAANDGEAGQAIDELTFQSSADCDKGNRTIRLFDLHDAALCYEPGKEVMLIPGSRVSISACSDPSGVTAGLICSPVACVLAAAAIRISSSPGGVACGDPYDIWSRDTALHVLNTNMRKHSQEEYSLQLMQSTGYRQIAKAAILEVTVRVGCEEGLSWEVECADNQLRLETCSDTTSALVQLVAQLQQLFAPDMQRGDIHWRHEGSNADLYEGGSEGVDVTSELLGTGGPSFRMSDSQEINVLEFFKAVLEAPGPQDRDSDSVSGNEDEAATGSYVHSGSSASFEERHELDSSVGPESNHSSLSPSKQKGLLAHGNIPDIHRPHQQAHKRPVFIEDYYLDAELSPATAALGQESEGKAGWYNEGAFSVLENHIPEVFVGVNELPKQSKRTPREGSHGGKYASPKKYPQPVGRIVLRHFSARWRLYGGLDWASGKVQDRLTSNLSKSGRQLGLCLEVILNDLDLRYDSFSEVGDYASRLVVAVRDIGVCDCSADAPWKMVLGYHRSAVRPRESFSRAVRVEMDAVRPDPTHPLEEYRLSVMLLPIRLHLDQRHIDFCIEFFSSKTDEELGRPTNAGAGVRPGSSGSEVLEEALLPFFQACDVKPFSIRVDYLPRRVDLSAIRGGNYAELLNLVSWKGIELHLKHVRTGRVHGWSSLAGIVFGDWLEDISQNQVHKFVKGVGPIRPLYAVGAGAAKLLVFPAEHYRKDRRVLRGMRKGAIAFLRSVSLEALGLGAQLAAGAHDLLYHTELALGGTRTTVTCTSDRGDISRKSNQPGDTREGIQQACESISRGLERTASSLVGNPVKVYQRGAGAGVAVACALRAAPAAAVAPAAAAVGAVRCALLGVRNGLDPEHKRESDEKHAGPSYMYQ